MVPVGPLKFRRTPEPVRRLVEVASATAWEAVVIAHSGEALRFATLMADQIPFGPAVDRYLDEMDVRDPMAAAIRSRALMTHRPRRNEETALGTGDHGTGSQGQGLRRFRPDRVVRGIARKVKENEAVEETLRLAIARAEEAVLRAHIDNAVSFGRVLRDHQGFDEAVEDYIDLMHISGGRAQAIYQRAMARLADLYLPDRDDHEGADDNARPHGQAGQGEPGGHIGA